MLGAIQSVPPRRARRSTCSVARRYTDLLAPEVAILVHALAERGVPAPADDQIGYELGDQAWQAELAWPVAAGRGHRARTRRPSDCIGRPIAAYRAVGWDARLPGDWPPDELGRADSAAEEGDR